MKKDEVKEFLENNDMERFFKQGYCVDFAKALIDTYKLKENQIHLVGRKYYDDLFEEEVLEACHMVIKHKGYYVDVEGKVTENRLKENASFINYSDNPTIITNDNIEKFEDAESYLGQSEEESYQLALAYIEKNKNKFDILFKIKPKIKP